VIALDTNVLVRYIVRDDEPQAAMATTLIETQCTSAHPGLVTLVVLCELVWVLRGYGYARAAKAQVLRKILIADELRVERTELAWQALNDFESGKADFADYVIGHCGKAGKAQVTCTFDQRTASSPLFRVLGPVAA
jgi:predicted nucleic-acid-binding protein